MPTVVLTLYDTSDSERTWFLDCRQPRTNAVGRRDSLRRAATARRVDLSGSRVPDRLTGHSTTRHYAMDIRG